MNLTKNILNKLALMRTDSWVIFSGVSGGTEPVSRVVARHVGGQVKPGSYPAGSASRRERGRRLRNRWTLPILLGRGFYRPGRAQRSYPWEQCEPRRRRRARLRLAIGG